LKTTTLTRSQSKLTHAEDYAEDGIQFDLGPGVDAMASPLAGLQPIHDRVLVRRIAEKRSAAPVVIAPDRSRMPSTKGVVVATGPGRTDADFVFRPTAVKPGDTIYFSPTLDTEHYGDVLKDGELILIQEADILFLVGQ